MNKSCQTWWTTFMFGFKSYFFSTGTTIIEPVLITYYHGKMVLFIFEKTILLISKKFITCVNLLGTSFFMTFRLVNTNLTIEILWQLFSVHQMFLTGCRMFGMKVAWDIRLWDMQCLGYRIFGIYDIWDMICLRCNMFRMLDIWHVECLGCGMFKKWNHQNVGCSRGEIFKMWNVGDLGYPRCGILAMYNIYDEGCSRFGMFRIWDVQDWAYLGCEVFRIWDVGDVVCLGFGMLECVTLGMWEV